MCLVFLSRCSLRSSSESDDEEEDEEDEEDEDDDDEEEDEELGEERQQGDCASTSVLCGAVACVRTHSWWRG